MQPEPESMRRDSLHARVAELERLLAEHGRAATAEELQRYQILKDGARDIVLFVRPDGRIREANAAAVQAYGYSLKELLSLTIDDLRAPETRAATAHQMAQADREGILFETVHRRKDGSVFPVEVSSCGTTCAGERVLLSVIRDISDRKRTEEALRQSNESLQALVAASPLAIYAVDPDGIVRLWNPACERLFGWRAEEVLGRPNPIVPPDKQEEFRSLRAQVLAGEGFTGRELERRRKDGTSVLIRLSTAPLRDARGNVCGIMSIAADMTSERQMEAELRQAQRMEAMGRLAGGVAHDFNNVLMAILGQCDLLQLRLPPGDPSQELIGEILKAADRGAALTRQLLAFSRKQVLEKKALDLNTLIAGLEKMLRRLLGEHIRVETFLTPTPAWVLADPGQLEQVILNLAVNARDAMPQGGRLRLETAVLDSEETPPGPAKPTVRLTICDTGCGMDAEIQNHLFEPFFTTKERGRGTGLGLATVYGIVQQSGGRITVSSRPGVGSTFTICLPGIEAPAAPEAAVRVPHVPSAATQEAILVVEDDPGVRGVVCQVLEMFGYEVLGAGRGDEALALVGRHTGPIHLMITDVVMPEMSGPELATRLRAMRPDLKVLFISGYPEAFTDQQGGMDAQSAFLQKPFNPDVLIERVRRLLETAKG